MSFQTDHKRKLENLTYHLNNIDELKRSVNGGNTILFTFPPDEEQEYIHFLKNHLQDNAEFIDIGSLFVNFIDSFEDMNEFLEVYQSLNPRSKIFKSNDPEGDLFTMIIKSIETANKNQKIPVIIRTGALCGTEIEHQTIMEHEIVMHKLKQPLVILYPSTIKNNELYFLGIRKANKYRCTLVE